MCAQINQEVVGGTKGKDKIGVVFQEKSGFVVHILDGKTD